MPMSEHGFSTGSSDTMHSSHSPHASHISPPSIASAISPILDRERVYRVVYIFDNLLLVLEILCHLLGHLFALHVYEEEGLSEYTRIIEAEVQHLELVGNDKILQRLAFVFVRYLLGKQCLNVAGG